MNQFTETHTQKYFLNNDAIFRTGLFMTFHLISLGRYYFFFFKKEKRKKLFTFRHQKPDFTSTNFWNCNWQRRLMIEFQKSIASHCFHPKSFCAWHAHTRWSFPTITFNISFIQWKKKKNKENFMRNDYSIDLPISSYRRYDQKIKYFYFSHTKCTFIILPAIYESILSFFICF